MQVVAAALSSVQRSRYNPEALFLGSQAGEETRLWVTQRLSAVIVSYRDTGAFSP